MAQVTDRNIGANPTGFDMRTELNNIIGALGSDNSGSSEPLNPVPYCIHTLKASIKKLKERLGITKFIFTVGGSGKLYEYKDGVKGHSLHWLLFQTFLGDPVDCYTPKPFFNRRYADKSYYKDFKGITNEKELLLLE